MRRALVLGGSGAVGGAVAAALAAAGAEVCLTFCSRAERAEALAAAIGARAARVDLREPDALRGLLGALEGEGFVPDILVHCAVAWRAVSFAEIGDQDWREALGVGPQAALVACQALAPRLAARGGGDVVLVGALTAGQSLPLPPHFAAAQGAMSALAMALARELGPAGVRVNMVALGVLEEGLSAALDASARAAYLEFSALRRVGTPAEAARAIAWLALENTYMSGRVLAVNGGI